MTRILVHTLRDAHDGLRDLDATITATATRARADGDELTLPLPVVVRLRNGEPSAPLELDEPDGTWAWEFAVRPTGAPVRDSITILRTFSGDEVAWADMTPVDPSTLEPLDPLPPSAQSILLRADEAVTIAEETIEDATNALSVANTAVVAGAVTGDNLVLQRKNGESFTAGNVRGLPGSTVPWGVDMGTAHLDTLTSSGVYRQNDSTRATTAQGYPLAGALGLLEVIQPVAGDAANVVQRYTVRSGAHASRGIYQRRRAGTWNPWVFLSLQRVDKTAGLALYTWDDFSGREQLVHGDTGIREVAADLVAPATGTLTLRRVGYMVHISGQVSPNQAASFDFYNLPAGFRRTAGGWVYRGFRPGSHVGLQNIVDKKSILGFNLTAYDPATFGAISFDFAFMTTDAWPTLLPGVASGTIPNI